MLLVLGACAPAPTEAEAGLTGALKGQDCVVIVLDALAAAHVGCYGGSEGITPRLDALAADGVRFDRVWSQTSWTLPSTVSLFTGLYQETHGVAAVKDIREKKLSDSAVTMAELFAMAGYDTRMYTQNPLVGERYGTAQGFERFHQGRDAPSRAAQADWADRDGRPMFVYLHFRRPHAPYDPDPEWAGRFMDSEYEGLSDGTSQQMLAYNLRQAELTEDDLEHHRDRYRANLAQADSQVADVLAELDLERTLVVVLSDHGEALNEHGRLGHSWWSYEEYVRIPLLMAHPALPRGEELDAPVMTVDVLPTLIDLFGLQSPDIEPQGTSLVGLLEGGSLDRKAIYTSSRRDPEGRQDLAVFDGRYKALVRLPARRKWLFDLTADPGEITDLSDRHPDELARLSALLADWWSRQRPLLGEDRLLGLDPADEEQLRELGYIK